MRLKNLKWRDQKPQMKELYEKKLKKNETMRPLKKKKNKIERS